MKSVTISLALTILIILAGNISFAQSEDNIFTSTKFGLKMYYPSDWSAIPAAPEYQEFTPGIYDYTAVVPPGQASVAEFCPSLELGSDPQSLACQTESSVYVGILAYKLNDGTTLKQFYEGNIKRGEQLKDLSGSPKIVEITKKNISGLSAIEKIYTYGGGGSLGKMLEQLGNDNPTSKHITISVLNGSIGYEFNGGTDDESDFDTYLPTFMRMFESIQIQGAKENPDNTMFVPEMSAATLDEAENSSPQDLVLLSHKLKKGSGNYNDVIGVVKNLGSETVEFVKIGINVYDKSGNLIGTDSTYAESTTLEPNQKSSFDIFTPKDNFNGMDSYELSLSWQTLDGADKYVDNAQIYKEQSTKALGNVLQTQGETDDSVDDLSKTKAICDTVTTQSGKDLCDTLLN